MTLTLRNIAKTYPGGNRALFPIDLDVAEGEIVSLLCQSGCGKTTLLRIIAGLETADSGAEIRFKGENMAALPVERRQVGMVFQSYALFPNMSVRGNIGYGLKMRGLPRAQIDARVDEVISLCRLEPCAGRAISALSGGQRQRVALARAFAPRPRLLLLDEPLSALDAVLRGAMSDELAALLRAFGITAIFVTHDQDEAMALADRLAVMSQGRVAQIGTPEALYRSPETSLVARFFGNALPLGGRIEGAMLHLPGGSLPLAAPAMGKLAFVRAEDVKLAPDGPVTARVKAVTFLGTHYRIAFTGAAADELFCLHQGTSAPRPGETARLTISPQSILTLNPEKSVA